MKISSKFPSEIPLGVSGVFFLSRITPVIKSRILSEILPRIFQEIHHQKIPPGITPRLFPWPFLRFPDRIPSEIPSRFPFQRLFSLIFLQILSIFPSRILPKKSSSDLFKISYSDNVRNSKTDFFQFYFPVFLPGIPPKKSILIIFRNSSYHKFSIDLSSDFPRNSPTDSSRKSFSDLSMHSSRDCYRDSKRFSPKIPAKIPAEIYSRNFSGKIPLVNFERFLRIVLGGFFLGIVHKVLHYLFQGFLHRFLPEESLMGFAQELLQESIRNSCDDFSRNLSINF